MAAVQDLLIELVTEELPPKALRNLSDAFAKSIHDSLNAANLLSSGSTMHTFATPRRLAVRLSGVAEQAPEQDYVQKLMPVSVGLDAQGQASPALTKKLQALGMEHLTPADLSREMEGSKEFLYIKGRAPGARLAQQIQSILDKALNQLPIPKMMRYQLQDGTTTVKFVRPAHQLLVMHGAEVLPACVLGIEAGNTTVGHRFLGRARITLSSAQEYETALEKDGMVIPAWEKRRTLIRQQLQQEAQALGASLGEGAAVEDLLDEVTALVELPKVYAAQFDETFLQVPQECLILTMRLNQKYFPLFDRTTGRLTNRFLIVSNMDIKDPANIIKGNERVVVPRLTDAQFFYQTDQKTPMQQRLDKLSNVVYHNKLGSQLERTQRIERIAVHIADQLGADKSQVQRAAVLAKNDLTSLMVGEFPELQGIMAAYYAQHAGEPAAVVAALAGQYATRYEQGTSPEELPALILFMAERFETLTGIWGIGLVPSGERDPYALRRAALGILSAYDALAAGGLADRAHQLDCLAVLKFAQQCFSQPLNPDTAAEVYDFILERLRNQLAEQYPRNEIDAVLTQKPPVTEIRQRLEAVRHFSSLPEAESLVAANKRIGNLLKKVDEQLPEVDASLFSEEGEKHLWQTVQTLAPQSLQAYQARDFDKALITMAGAREAVDQFFNDVMVMTDEAAVRQNRLALLASLQYAMNLVADVARI